MYNGIVGLYEGNNLLLHIYVIHIIRRLLILLFYITLDDLLKVMVTISNVHKS